MCWLILARRKRALETSHRFAESNGRRPKRDTNEYVPEMSLRVDLDKNLGGSAGRGARFLLKEAYQKARWDRRLRITVSCIAQGLDLSVRHVRRLLAVLHREQHIGGRLPLSVTEEFAKSGLDCESLLAQLRELVAATEAPDS